MKSIIGLNIFASFKTPKNNIAKMNMAVIGAIFFIPVRAKLAVSTPYPASIEPAIGTKIKAVKAEVILPKIRTNKTTIIRIPIIILRVCIYSKRVNLIQTTLLKKFAN